MVVVQKTNILWSKTFPVLLIVVLVSACAPSRYQHMRNVYTAEAPVRQGVHRVRKGDTLYSIAFKYNRNFQELARANNINKPYKIVPGQIIDLKKTSPNQPASANQPNSAISQKQPSRYKKPSNDAKLVQEKVANQRHKDVNMSWRWPTDGSVIRGYTLAGSKINKGIDLAGNRGDPVYAAAEGEVVYQGTGMVGYGNLIIIKHNEQYLSAYAHNSRMLLKEGEKVKAGQKIAEIGSTGASRDQLHFEIRRHGKPIDPLPLLPSR